MSTSAAKSIVPRTKALSMSRLDKRTLRIRILGAIACNLLAISGNAFASKTSRIATTNVRSAVEGSKIRPSINVDSKLSKPSLTRSIIALAKGVGTIFLLERSNKGSSKRSRKRDNA